MPALCASLEIATLFRRSVCSYGVLICRSDADDRARVLDLERRRIDSRIRAANWRAAPGRIAQIPLRLEQQRESSACPVRARRKRPAFIGRDRRAALTATGCRRRTVRTGSLSARSRCRSAADASAGVRLWPFQCSRRASASRTNRISFFVWLPGMSTRIESSWSSPVRYSRLLSCRYS